MTGCVEALVRAPDVTVAVPGAAGSAILGGLFRPVSQVSYRDV